ELEDGAYQGACDLFQKSLTLRREIGDKRGIVKSLEGIGRVAEAMGKGENAARTYAAAEALRIAIAVPMSSAEKKSQGQIKDSVKERFPSAWKEGSQWSFDEAINYALSLRAA